MSVGFFAHEGHLLSADHARIAQIIHDYDPRLELAYIPPNMRGPEDTHPYAVIYNNPQTGNRDLVMRLRETEVDHRVLARLWEADSSNGTQLIDKLDAEDAARRAIEMQKRMDEEAEAREMAAWMIKAPVGAKINGRRLT